MKEARQRFSEQRKNAVRRGIAWEMTFEQWWEIWQASGKYAERGPAGHQYVMARKWDRGPYATGNVDIQLARENLETVRVRRRMRRTRLPLDAVREPVCDDPLEILIEAEEMS